MKFPIFKMKIPIYPIYDSIDFNIV